MELSVCVKDDSSRFNLRARLSRYLRQFYDKTDTNIAVFIGLRHNYHNFNLYELLLTVRRRINFNNVASQTVAAFYPHVM